jgi:dTDP-glucose pyrophosphorylase
MLNTINLVLCLAGKGQRFIDDGILIPKYLLKNNKGEPILNLIIKNLIQSGIRKFFLFVNKDNLEYKKNLLDVMTSFKDAYFELIFIPHNSGQAETAKIACSYIKKKFPESIYEPIGFHNGDTILINRDLSGYLPIESFTWDGLIDTFVSNDPAYSYVKVEDEQVLEIKEKDPISFNATSGLYFFKNLRIYEKFYNSCNFYLREKFISNVYENMLLSGCVIKNNHCINPLDTVLLGTPKLYKEWLQNDLDTRT